MLCCALLTNDRPLSLHLWSPGSSGKPRLSHLLLFLLLVILCLLPFSSFSSCITSCRGPLVLHVTRVAHPSVPASSLEVMIVRLSSSLRLMRRKSFFHRSGQQCLVPLVFILSDVQGDDSTFLLIVGKRRRRRATKTRSER